MTNPFRSTWPEIYYALSLTKTGTWPAQRTAMQLFCAEAFHQDIFAGPFVCSHRDLASHLYRSEDSGHSAAGRLMNALVERGVLRELAKGSGTAPSEWDVAHWTRWDVPWRIREASAHDRVRAFAAGGIRSQGRNSGVVLIRSLAKSARVDSAANAALAVLSKNEGARLSTADSTPQVNDSRLDRYDRFLAPPYLSIYLSDDKTSVIVGGGEGGREGEQISDKVRVLALSFMQGAGIKQVQGSIIRQLTAIAEMANGSFEEICKKAADPFGPGKFVDRLNQLRQFAESPHPDTAFGPKRIASQHRRGLEQSIRILEQVGGGESEEAYELRQQLATLEECERNPE